MGNVLACLFIWFSCFCHSCLSNLPRALYTVANAVAKMSTNELLTIAREFLKTLRPLDKETFESSSYDDVLKDVNDIQSQRELTKKMINMKRIHPFLIGMASLEKVLVAIKFQQTSDVMACIWGSIRFFLKVMGSPASCSRNGEQG